MALSCVWSETGAEDKFYLTTVEVASNTCSRLFWSTLQNAVGTQPLGAESLGLVIIGVIFINITESAMPVLLLVSVSDNIVFICGPFEISVIDHRYSP